MSEAEQTQTTNPPAAQQPPATATAVAEKPQPEAQAQTPNPAAEVAEKSQPQKEAPQTPKPADRNFVRERFLEREQKRAEKEKQSAERIAELQRQLKQFQEQAQQTKPQTEAMTARPDPLVDPEGYDKWNQEQARKAVQAEFESRENAAKEQQIQARYAESMGEAEKWLLTRQHIKQDAKLAEDVMRVVAEKYPHIAASPTVGGAGDPLLAIEKAYRIVCAEKGIVPDLEELKGLSHDPLNASKGSASSGARQSAPASGARVFSAAEIQRYLAEPDPSSKDGYAELARRSAEVEQACGQDGARATPV